MNSAERHSIVYCAFRCLLLGIMTIVLSGTAKAEQSSFYSEQLTIRSSEHLVSAQAIIYFTPAKALSFNPNAVEVAKNAPVELPLELEKIEDDIWLAYAKIPQPYYRLGAMITVLATDRNNSIISLPAAPLVRKTLRRPETVECLAPDQTISIEKLLKLDQRSLEQLIEIRRAKRGVLEDYLRQLLTGPKVDAIGKVVQSVGLLNSTKISASEPTERLLLDLAKLESLIASQR